MKMRFWNGADPWPEVAEELAVEESEAGWAWRNQQVLWLADMQQEQRFVPGLYWLRARGARSYCVLPLTTSNQKLGALGFASKRANAFATADEQFLLRVAEMVALSLDETQPQSALLEERERVTLLLEVSRSQVRTAGEPSLDIQERIARFLQPLERWASQSYVGLYLYDPQVQSLRLYTREPELGPRLVTGGAAPLEGTIAGRAFRNKQPEVLGYADLSRSTFPSVKCGLEMGVKSLCMVPVFQAGEPVGVLKVASRIDRAFSLRDIDLLTEVAAMASELAREIPIAFLASEEMEQSQQLLKVSNGFNQSPSENAKRVASGHRGPAKLIPFISSEAGSEFENLFGDYFGSSIVGFCVLDTEFRYLAINHTLAKMNGAPAEAHLGKSVTEVLGDVGARIKPELERVLATGESVSNFEATGILPSASTAGMWLASYFPIKDAQGEVKGVGAAVVELPKQHKTDESVRQLTDRLLQEQNRLQVLREIDIALTRHLDLKQLFAAIAICLEAAVPFDLAGIWLYEQVRQTMRTAAVDSRIGEVFPEGESVPLSECMLGQAMLRGEFGALNFADLKSLSFPGSIQLLEHGIKCVWHDCSGAGRRAAIVVLRSLPDSQGIDRRFASGP